MHQILRRRHPVALALIAAGLALPMAAHAQEDYRQIVTDMRSCARITEIAARVACYDGAIAPREQGSMAARAEPPPQSGTVPAAPPVAAAPPPVRPGFGAEMLPTTRAAREAEQDPALEARVAGVRQVQPGIAVLTLDDGAQWRFVDAASFSYDMPGQGDTVRLQRGSLGSFYLHFNGQRALRIQRVR